MAVYNEDDEVKYIMKRKIIIVASSSILRSRKAGDSYLPLSPIYIYIHIYIYIPEYL